MAYCMALQDWSVGYVPTPNKPLRTRRATRLSTLRIVAATRLIAIAHRLKHRKQVKITTICEGNLTCAARYFNFDGTKYITALFCTNLQQHARQQQIRVHPCSVIIYGSMRDNSRYRNYSERARGKGHVMGRRVDPVAVITGTEQYHRRGVGFSLQLWPNLWASCGRKHGKAAPARLVGFSARSQVLP